MGMVLFKMLSIALFGVFSFVILLWYLYLMFRSANTERLTVTQLHQWLADEESYRKITSVDKTVQQGHGGGD